MRAYRIDASVDEGTEMEVDPTLKNLLKLTGCDCITIVKRKVGGIPMNIVLDDEGLLKPNTASAMSTKLDMSGENEVLMGKILLFGVDYDGDLRSLSELELRLIRANMRPALFSDGRTRSILTYDW